jgi:hypothetical protein
MWSQDTLWGKKKKQIYLKHVSKNLSLSRTTHRYKGPPGKSSVRAPQTFSAHTSFLILRNIDSTIPYHRQFGGNFKLEKKVTHEWRKLKKNYIIFSWVPPTFVWVAPPPLWVALVWDNRKFSQLQFRSIFKWTELRIWCNNLQCMTNLKQSQDFQDR